MTSKDRKSTRLNSSHVAISYAVVFVPSHTPSLFPYTTLFRSHRVFLPFPMSLEMIAMDLLPHKTNTIYSVLFLVKYDLSKIKHFFQADENKLALQNAPEFL